MVLGWIINIIIFKTFMVWTILVILYHKKKKKNNNFFGSNNFTQRLVKNLRRKLIFIILKCNKYILKFKVMNLVFAFGSSCKMLISEINENFLLVFF